VLVLLFVLLPGVLVAKGSYVCFLFHLLYAESAICIFNRVCHRRGRRTD
jgi:hypothetical protein